MNIRTIAALIKTVSYSSINEFTASDNTFSIRISQVPQKRQSTVERTNHPLEKKEICEFDDINPISVDEFKSPMVGIYYSSLNENTEPYIVIGNLVNPGKRLGVIRSMNINTIIYASKKMTISDILVKNGQPVEYDQALYLVNYG
ncbi:acetyl-CoA carboxylase biotin carboxyl carrier protein [Enterobacter ludwigii]|uniref:acetyl-CoA carboxylase biotin carboxyl carrier protein n=1 Tax=Enterobacter ludwigii TaxID=299767 RepID=UPI00397716FD